MSDFRDHRRQMMEQCIGQSPTAMTMDEVKPQARDTQSRSRPSSTTANAKKARHPSMHDVKPSTKTRGACIISALLTGENPNLDYLSHVYMLLRTQEEIDECRHECNSARGRANRACLALHFANRMRTLNLKVPPNLDISIERL